MSAKSKIINYLSKSRGENTLTVAQARARFGITNVAARIEELRAEGHCIYTSKKVLSDGRRVSYYKLGRPTKEMIAAAHAVLGAEVFA